uniref:OrNV_gp124-like protein n=1 Tax=Nilaparvata lugens endogenous nudivirus TaxID=1487700 RepID=X5GE39_9VIRU|nr:OrNV_gp124-like protein [Nilaparvata lugens endogenous nudivirus]
MNVVNANNIRNNDRLLRCDGNCNRRSIDITLPQFQSLSVSANFINVAELEATLVDVSKSIDARIDEYKRWLEEQEVIFEAKYMMKLVRADNDLFNKINNTISHLKQGKKTLNYWYVMMRNMYAEILENLFTYKRNKDALENNIQANDYIGGLGINPVVTAHRKEHRSKSIAKQITRIHSSQTNLENLIMLYRAQLSSFERNILHVDNRELDMIQLSKEIESLSDTGSPLMRVQEDLASRINAITIKQSLNTNSSTLDRFNATKLDFTEFPINPDAYANTDQLVEFLNNIKNTHIYTNNSKSKIEKVLDYAVRVSANTHNENIVVQLRNSIPYATIHPTLFWTSLEWKHKALCTSASANVKIT